MNDKDKQEIDLNISSTKTGEFMVINLEGEVDVYSAGMLREEIINQVDNGEYNIVVNLSKVAFLDSTGLGVLVGGLKRVKPHDGQLGIICQQEKILRIFRITGMDKIFPIYSGVEELGRARVGD
jgi:anti-sigma B factor antagonist